MRRPIARLSGLVLAGGLCVAGLSTPSPAVAAVPTGERAPAAVPTGDELPHPLEAKRRALRTAGLTAVLDGERTPEKHGRSTVVKVGEQGSGRHGKKAKGDPVTGPTQVDGRDQYAELDRTGTDKIFVVLAEFGDERDPRYPDGVDYDPDAPGPTTYDGPLHNRIPRPAADDNSTVWQEDFSAEHYRDLYFGDGADSLTSYYRAQSSGRYSVDGEVTDWVRVRYNEARYGRSSDYAGVDPAVCGSNVCSNTWALVRDALTAWVADKQARGATSADLARQLASFDQQDRYDYDGDGEFHEPDGYLDHFQIVHAGGDESDGDPQQGQDAIWAHRWYAYGTDIGTTGPAFNKLGGAPVGDTGLWVGDYTIQPENGGVSVFAHEFGHDLGLPDHYDTAGGDNGVEYWNLMAQSRLSDTGEALGTRAGDLSAWDKLQLGWLDYRQVTPRTRATLDLGPHEAQTGAPQALVVSLPDKPLTVSYGAPATGTGQYWSGSGDDLDTTATFTRDDLGGSLLSFAARYAVEKEYDYAYVETTTDGTTWTTPEPPAGSPFVEVADGRFGLTGEQPTWVPVSLTLPEGTRAFRFRYVTDGGVAEAGFFADDVTVTPPGSSTPTLVDGAEAAPTAALDGFSVVGTSATRLVDNYYLASNRSYTGYDRYLRTGPYNFFDPARPDTVEHFAYEQGLLVSYWDTSWLDNNTSAHPGAGLVLPVDASPQANVRSDGVVWRSRMQVFDAPFGRLPVADRDLRVKGVPSPIKGHPGVPVFDDRRSYWDPAKPGSSVQVPHTGTRLQVVRQDGPSMTVKVG